MISLILAALVPGVQIDGAWLDAEAAKARGLAICESDGRVTLENRSGAVVRPEELGWRKEGKDDFDVPGLKVYLEGWQMATPCGVRNWDDEPFDYSLGYLNNCVSTPSDFKPGEKGRFQADHMCCFRRPDGKMRLYGFVTGKERFGHFRMKLAEKGADEFYVLSACDRAELKPGAKIVSEKLVVIDGDDTEALFGDYASRWAKASGARRKFEAPLGWCSWYYYFDKVTLKDVVANADWIAAHRNDGFGKVKVMQLDDGYQAALGDWLIPNEKFPGGVAAFAREMKTRGFTPAIWVGPFMVEENSRLKAEHPDWLVKGADGKPAVSFMWREGHKVYSLDGTNPAVLGHFRKLFKAIREAGIEYVKLDFCMLASSVPDAKYHNPSATRAQALRWAFEAIREGFGDDGFLLGCTAPFGPLVGIVDAMRSSTDITPYWQKEGHQHAEAPTIPNVCRNIINHKYMCGRLWVNDPDTLIVRDDSTKLTEDEVKLWATAISFVGGSLLLSDNFTTLSEKRLPLVKRAIADFGKYSRAYPADRWENTYPEVWKAEYDGRIRTAKFSYKDPHGVQMASAKGRWVNEAGIMKFIVGADAAKSRAQSEAAYNMPASDKTWHVEPTMTLDEVNALDVKPGDKVLFRRGGVWRGQLRPRSGKPGAPVYYGAYGEGQKPVIQTSYDRSRPEDWREIEIEGGKFWMTETGASADIGNIIFDNGSKGCAFKHNKLSDLKNDFDFWCNPKTFEVYVKCSANPATKYASLELSEKIHAVDEAFQHDVVYDGLWLRYTAAHGIGGMDTARITVRNCDICWIGGGYLYYDKKGNGVRYGNGIEFWSAAEGHVVESNRIWEVWDAALTNQSNKDGAEQKNITYRGNRVWNCEYSYEYWQQGKGSKTENILVEDNHFTDAGKGWGHKQRWNPNAGHLMFYDTTAETKNFVVRNNVFSRSEDTLFRLFNDWRKSLVLEGNVWEAKDESVCRYHGRPTADLKYRYPDRLDQMHDDNQAEIESQGTGARVFRAGELEEFLEFMRSARK